MLPTTSIMNFSPVKYCIKSEEKGNSPLKGKVRFDWQTVFVVANSALILAGIAFAFFMKLPALMVGLGFYGVANIIIYLLAKKTQSQLAKPKEYVLSKEESKSILELSLQVRTLIDLYPELMEFCKSKFSDLQENNSKLCFEIGPTS